MTESDRKCRWGVVGTAMIAHKLVPAMSAAPDATPVAIASRSLDRAEAFAKEMGLERAYGSYEELLEDSTIDVVYIPIPTGVRKQVVLDAAAAGKHILCEKPVAIDAESAEEIIKACDVAGVQFMDGASFVHHDQFKLTLERLSELGPIPTMVDSAFTFLADDNFLATNIRTSMDTEPLGCVGDVAWYNARITLGVMQSLPTVVRARHHEMHGGVPIHTTGEFEYAGEKGPRICPFQCSYRHALREWVEIVGDRGAIWMHAFVHGNPKEAVVEIHTDPMLENADTLADRESQRIVLRDCVQDVVMIQTLSRIALGLDPLDPKWPQWSLDTQRVIDAIMKSAHNGGVDTAV